MGRTEGRGSGSGYGGVPGYCRSHPCPHNILPQGLAAMMPQGTRTCTLPGPLSLSLNSPPPPSLSLSTVHVRSLAASWIVDTSDFFSQFRIELDPRGNSRNTSALVLSCFEVYGQLVEI